MTFEKRYNKIYEKYVGTCNSKVTVIDVWYHYGKQQWYPVIQDNQTDEFKCVTTSFSMIMKGGKKRKAHSTKYKSDKHRQRIYSIKQRAKRCNIKLDLTWQQIQHLISQPCIYCNYLDDTLNGIDRIDSTLGYIEGNVQSCCEFCNRGKHQLSHKQFLEHIKSIASHNRW